MCHILPATPSDTASKAGVLPPTDTQLSNGARSTWPGVPLTATQWVSHCHLSLAIYSLVAWRASLHGPLGILLHPPPPPSPHRVIALHHPQHSSLCWHEYHHYISSSSSPSSSSSSPSPSSSHSHSSLSSSSSNFSSSSLSIVAFDNQVHQPRRQRVQAHRSRAETRS